MKRVSPILRKISAGLLLLLFIGYVGSTTLFYHIHYVDGGRIVHSHPYSGKPLSESHTHTAFEFATIAVLSVLLATAVFLCCLPAAFVTRVSGRPAAARTSFHHRARPALSLRGPPTR